MKMLLFAGRNAKEIIRDPINLFFGLGFPLVLLFLFYIINQAIPPEAQNTLFEIQNTAPGIAVFGTSFFALFAGMLLAKDRTSSFLMRLFSSPMRSLDFLLGYTVPLLAMAVLQGCITFLAAVLFGLPVSVYILPAIAAILPTAILFTGIGLLCGSLLNDTAVGGVCGALLTNIAGWFSGVWIPLDLIGGAFKKTAEILPFYHAVQVAKTVLTGSFTGIAGSLSIVLLYTAVVYTLAVIIFRSRMKG